MTITASQVLPIIDRANGHVIQKARRPNGVVVYQVLPDDAIGDGSKSQQFNTLGEARKMAGFKAASTTKVTLPKSAYAQNQKGYDPHRK